MALKDGRRLDDVRLAAKGDASLPFGPDERKTKFLDCANFSGVPLAEAHELYVRCSHPTALDAPGVASFSLAN